MPWLPCPAACPVPAELNGGYAADGYARKKGVGCAVVTFCVGGFSILNAIAGAYSEDLPGRCRGVGVGSLLGRPARQVPRHRGGGPTQKACQAGAEV